MQGFRRLQQRGRRPHGVGRRAALGALLAALVLPSAAGSTPPEAPFPAAREAASTQSRTCTVFGCRGPQPAPLSRATAFAAAVLAAGWLGRRGRTATH